jgi:hypothetical protein
MSRAVGLPDLRRFVIVAWLHHGRFAGALLGVIAAAVYVKRQCRAAAASTSRDAIFRRFRRAFDTSAARRIR